MDKTDIEDVLDMNTNLSNPDKLLDIWKQQISPVLDVSAQSAKGIPTNKSRAQLMNYSDTITR